MESPLPAFSPDDWLRLRDALRYVGIPEKVRSTAAQLV